MRHKAEFAVGAFAIVVFAILAFMTFKVGELAWFRKPGYRVYVTFKNTGGLDEKARIKVAGVDAGTIQKIELSDGRARLTLRVYPSVTLYSDAVAGIKSAGLLGDRFLEIKIGSRAPALKDGDTIKNVEEIVEVDDLVKNLSGFSNSLSEAAEELSRTLKDTEARQSLKEIFANVREMTRDLKQTVRLNREKFNDIVARLDSITASLDNLIEVNRAPLTNTIANAEKASEELRALLLRSRPNIESLTNSVNAVAQKIERGEGTLGKLITDEKLYSSITNTVGGLEKTVSAIDRFRLYITLKTDYIPRIKDGKGYFYLTLQPRKEKYYILGIVDDPIGTVKTVERITDGVTVTEEEVEAQIQFVAQFARRFKDTALRAGLYENSLGVGIDQFLFGDKLILRADGWDWRAQEFQAENPHVRVGADYFLFKHVFLMGGADNLLNSNRISAYFGGGLRFEDEDFKYLLSSLPGVP